MTDWYVGQKVVCVNGRFERHEDTHPFEPQLPVENSVYTIRAVLVDPIWKEVAFQLVEIINPVLEYCEHEFEQPWMAFRFRPLVSQNADISVFECLLDPLNNREVVDA